MKDEEMYKNRQNLTYPINMARNIAKVNSQTHFTFPSDIELYPTKNFISKFLEFIRRNPHYAVKESRSVFVLPVFEILAGYQVSSLSSFLRQHQQGNRHNFENNMNYFVGVIKSHDIIIYAIIISETSTPVFTFLMKW